MKTLLTTTAAALLIAGTAYSASDRVQETAGEPDDQTVVEAQERADLPRTFTEWDTDHDGYLSREEYEAGVQGHPNAAEFPTWDELDAQMADPEGRMTAQDFQDSVSKYYPADAITRGSSESLGGSGDGGGDGAGSGSGGTDGAGGNDGGSNGTDGAAE